MHCVAITCTACRVSMQLGVSMLLAASMLLTDLQEPELRSEAVPDARHVGRSGRDSCENDAIAATVHRTVSMLLVVSMLLPEGYCNAQSAPHLPRLSSTSQLPVSGLGDGAGDGARANREGSKLEERGETEAATTVCGAVRPYSPVDRLVLKGSGLRFG